jgi:ribosome-binding factor A
LRLGRSRASPTGSPHGPARHDTSMAQYRRTDRINEQLRQEIALLIRDEVRDPRVGLATITAVETSPELDHARVYVTALGEDEEKEEILIGLRSAAPFIRGQLGRRLHMRRIPELHFQIDRKLENALRIESLLREALPDAGDDPVEGGEDQEA